MKTKKEYIEFLKKLNPCEQAMNWTLACEADTAQQVWEMCDKWDWMTWLVSWTVTVRKNSPEHRHLVGMTLEIVQQVEYLMPEASKVALSEVKAWQAGDDSVCLGVAAVSVARAADVAYAARAASAAARADVAAHAVHAASVASAAYAAVAAVSVARAADVASAAVHAAAAASAAAYAASAASAAVHADVAAAASAAVHAVSVDRAAYADANKNTCNIIRKWYQMDYLIK